MMVVWQIKVICFLFLCFEGCGSGFLFPPTLVILGRYFRKRRGLANGLSMASACLGSLAYPLFIRFCMDEYGVRGALLLISGIYMHIFIAVCLLTPPEQYRPKTKSKLQEKENLLNPLVVDTSVNDSSLSSSLPNIRVPREPVRKRRTMTISEDINPSNSNDRSEILNQAHIIKTNVQCYKGVYKLVCFIKNTTNNYTTCTLACSQRF